MIIGRAWSVTTTTGVVVVSNEYIIMRQVKAGPKKQYLVRTRNTRRRESEIHKGGKM